MEEKAVMVEIECDRRRAMTAKNQPEVARLNKLIADAKSYTADLNKRLEECNKKAVDFKARATALAKTAAGSAGAVKKTTG